MQNDVRKVIIEPIDATIKKKPEKVVKEKSKRVVTQSNKWLFTVEDLSIEYQHQLLDLCSLDDHQHDKKTQFMIQQIHQKIYGYKTQDLEKNLYTPTEFVDFSFVIHRLKTTPNCFYCKDPVHLIYEFVREPKQWTLDRIDNSRGHNCDNVEIACLRCNLRRRLMHHERFVFTKQLLIKKTT